MKKRVTLTFPRRIVQMPITYRLATEFNVAVVVVTGVVMIVVASEVVMTDATIVITSGPAAIAN